MRQAPPFALGHVLAALAAVAACDSPSVAPLTPTTSTCETTRLVRPAVPRRDILIVVDDSASMADAPALGTLVANLVATLVVPPCIDPQTGLHAPVQPGPLDRCSDGAVRALEPSLDVHIGVVSSSLGGHGSDACAGADGHAHLATASAQPGGATLPTYEGLGFLAWDPAAALVPPGIASLEGELAPRLDDLVRGVGARGCGYEAPLEAMVRFLVDPAPAASIDVVDGEAVRSGVDEVVLAQRKAFLRPDSEVLVVVVSDENDCSIVDGGQYYYAAQQRLDGAAFHLPRARAECAVDPYDACCYSCGQTNTPAPCGADPSCGTLDAELNPPSLRCFAQKRRFGIDFLWPIERYVNALTEIAIDPDSPTFVGAKAVPSPLFSDLDPNDDAWIGRGPERVHLLVVAGVPWQDVARDPADAAKGVQSGEQLAAPRADGTSTWDDILGDPSHGVPPRNPLMVESVAPRGGASPATGAPLAPPSSSADANPVNGHEHAATDELQYACVFPLPAPRDCANVPPDVLDPDCRCADTSLQSPLCDPGAPGIATRAGAYPSTRQLAVARGLGARGHVGSICPAQVADPTTADYGFRPAVQPLLEQLEGSYTAPWCVPRALPIDDEGRVPCVAIEARRAGPSGCRCNPSEARIGVAPEHAGLVDDAKRFAVERWDCFCEIPQLTGPALQACRNDLDDGDVARGGFCYVAPPAGDPRLVEDCPDTAKHRVRFFGPGAQQPGSGVFLACCADDTEPAH